ncbi:MAG: MraY family glycosyltransferase [Saprospiraceae bacterium]|nr:MraY family glycosyltransferase [Saprospiraceae bacterium]
MFAVILGFLTAFTLTYLALPVIIRIARDKHLYDMPNERSAHREPTPSLGGIGIYGGVVCAVVLWMPSEQFWALQYVLAALVIIFFIGVKDDLMPLSPTKKFMGQVTAALILVYKANLKISGLYGILGVYDLPGLFSFVLSIVVIVGIINAFNLIDGINGLAGSIGLLACITWGSWFFLVGHLELAVLAACLAGALTAFLKFNFTPARIFMGDTGSMLIGLICSVFAIRFIELQREIPLGDSYSFNAAPAIALGILILPVFDTMRVFARRLWMGRSPFTPDRAHIHHLLLDNGLTHTQATAVLVGVNVVFIAVAFYWRYLGAGELIAIEFALAAALTFLLFQRTKLQRRGRGKWSA